MIDKVGGIIIKNKKVLVVRKKTKGNFPEFIIPGGKREIGETDVETLQREIQEEVNLKVVKAEYESALDKGFTLYKNIHECM